MKIFTHQPSISNTPSDDTKGISTCTDGQGEDFSRVNPKRSVSIE